MQKQQFIIGAYLYNHYHRNVEPHTSTTYIYISDVFLRILCSMFTSAGCVTVAIKPHNTPFIMYYNIDGKNSTPLTKHHGSLRQQTFHYQNQEPTMAQAARPPFFQWQDIDNEIFVNPNIIQINFALYISRQYYEKFMKNLSVFPKPFKKENANETPLCSLKKQIKNTHNILATRCAATTTHDAMQTRNRLHIRSFAPLRPVQRSSLL